MGGLGLDVSKEEVDDLFDSWDLDHSNEISFDELKKVLYGRTGPVDTSTKKKEKRVHVKASILGKDFDLDESPGAPPISKQIGDALKASSGKVLDFFRELDASGDGYVSKIEFRSAMTKLGLEVPQEDVDRLFNEWDMDNDGELSFEELKLVLANRKLPPAATTSTSPPATRRKGVDRGTGKSTSLLGKDFDLDESPGAPPIAQQLAEGLAANSVKVLDLFREMDASGDGSVARSEFRREMGNRLGLDLPAKEIDQLFNEWDANHDGEMSFDELKKVLAASSKR